MEAGAHLKERADAAVNVRSADGGLRDPREQFEERALARPVAANDPDDLSVPDLERRVLERPELARWRSAPSLPLPQPPIGLRDSPIRSSNRLVGS